MSKTRKCKPGTPIAAGKSFAEAMKTDAGARAAWERVRSRLTAFADALKQARAESAAARKELHDELTRVFREALRAIGDELLAKGFTPPRTIEDWNHLARIVEIPIETVREGKLTIGEIHDWALAWADRQKIKARLASEAGKANVVHPSSAKRREDQDATEFGGPVPDPQDTRKVMWAGKSVYLGSNTAISRLFWLLAKPVGRAVSMDEVQSAVDGVRTPTADGRDGLRKARQRARKAITRLRQALEEAELDTHVLVVRSGPHNDSQYALVRRFDQ